MSEPGTCWLNGRRRRSLLGASTLLIAALATPWDAAWSDNFADVHYDARKDQLIVTILYRGTNPDHAFSLNWGQCRALPNGGSREIVAEVLDSHWNDAAERDFRTTQKFSLEALKCRPAKVTLRMAPRFYYTLQIPARTVTAP